MTSVNQNDRRPNSKEIVTDTATVASQATGASVASNHASTSTDVVVTPDDVLRTKDFANKHISNNGNTNNNNNHEKQQQPTKTETETKHPKQHQDSTNHKGERNAQGKQPQQRRRRRSRKRFGARNQHRHKSFVKWLVTTFPEVFVSTQPTNTNNDTNNNTTSSLDNKDDNTHVLDIAGGKGEVAARLSMCHLENVILVDPRKADIVHCFETLVLPKIPKKWQQKILGQQLQQQDVTTNCSNKLSSHTSLQDEETNSIPFCLEVNSNSNKNFIFPKDYNKNKTANDDTNSFIRDRVNQRCRQLVMEFSEKNIYNDNDNNELLAAIENSKIIIGLHADSATELIIDISLKYSKPFVVVPCCVFPNLFPERRLKVKRKLIVDLEQNKEKDTHILATQPATTSKNNGVSQEDPNDKYDSDNNKEEIIEEIPVRTYEDFCQYLSQKDPRLKIETLPFEGRNIAIYWNGQ